MRYERNMHPLSHNLRSDCKLWPRILLQIDFGLDLWPPTPLFGHTATLYTLCDKFCFFT